MYLRPAIKATPKNSLGTLRPIVNINFVVKFYIIFLYMAKHNTIPYNRTIVCHNFNIKWPSKKHFKANKVLKENCFELRSDLGFFNIRNPSTELCPDRFII